MKHQIRNFLFPSLTRRFLLRLAIVSATAFIVFRFIAVPAKIQGKSMVPTYRDGSIVLYTPWLRHFKQPAINDVVLVRLAGNRVMLIKRVIGLPGDVIEWQNGALVRNGVAVEEPYVQFNDGWNLDAATVPPDNVYVVGDNRGMPLKNHDFGYTSQKRIAGYPLW